MNKDIKADILLTARKLFNKGNYNAVSMRDIANELNISVGNLTYYFKKKEDLAEAIILEQHKAYKKFNIPGTLEELHLFFQQMLEHQKENAYYFRNYKQLAQISAKIYQIQLRVIKDKYETLQKAFAALYAGGLLKDDEISGQKDLVIDAVMSVSTYGTLQNEENRLDCIWALIYPLLTKKGIAVYTGQITGRTGRKPVPAVAGPYNAEYEYWLSIQPKKE